MVIKTRPHKEKVVVSSPPIMLGQGYSSGSVGSEWSWIKSIVLAMSCGRVCPFVPSDIDVSGHIASVE